MLAGPHLPQESLGIQADLGWPGWPGLCLFALVALLHVLLAAAVHQDASRRVERAKPVAFAGPLVWSLATLVGGLAGLALYWAIHYSTLRDKDESSQP